jgi:hypothetical protein
MEIRISARDMLLVLIESGMDETEAKAIIFDLLQVPEDGKNKNMNPREALEEARQEAKRRKKKKDQYEYEDEDEEDEYEDGEEEEAEGEDEDEVDEVKPIKKKRKRVNFASFGGASRTPISS